jgi:hypothetical protein
MKKISIILLSFILTLTVGCSKFESINNNPNDPVKVKSEVVLNNILYSTFGADAGISGLYSTFIGGEIGGSFSQQFSKSLYNTCERYYGVNDNSDGIWNTMYEDVCMEAKSMNSLAIAEGNNITQGISLVLLSYGFQVLTDTYGDIPYSEALRGSEQIFTPKYDSQEDVYAGINNMLIKADSLLATNVGTVAATSDIMYNGDATKWRKFANSLRFRLLMRVSNKTSSKIGNISTQLSSIVASGNLFTSNSDEAKFKLASNPAANPFYENIGIGNTQGFCVAEPFVNLVLLTQDSARLSKFCTTNDAGNYVGKPSGYAVVPSTYALANVSQIGSTFTSESSPVYYMSYSQLLFLLAEARQRNLISTGTVSNYYYAGVEANFLALGLTSTDYNNFINKSTINLNATNELLQIHRQEYIALFGQGMESWYEHKRNNVPVLSLPIDANPQVTSIPVRCTYPQDEQTNNKTNYNAAIANQGADLLTTKFWWLN